MIIILPRIYATRCLDIDGGLICTRADGHEGRHAATLVGGKVARVWGEDVHVWRRIRSRGRNTIAHIDRALETAQTWDGVAR